jgi:hypothetical protein
MAAKYVRCAVRSPCEARPFDDRRILVDSTNGQTPSFYSVRFPPFLTTLFFADGCQR